LHKTALRGSRLR